MRLTQRRPGAQGRLSYYSDYARTLAGWGYAVLQYDLACWTAAPKLLQSVPCPQLENIADEVRPMHAASRSIQTITLQPLLRCFWA